MKKTKILLFILAFVLCLPFVVSAETVSVELTKKEIESSSYTRYEFSDESGFQCTFSNPGESAFFGVFIFDDTVQWNMKLNGESIDYQSGSLITEQGKYELMVVGESEEAVFNFEISLEAFDSLDELLNEDIQLSESDDKILNELIAFGKSQNIEGLENVSGSENVKVDSSDTQSIENYLNSKDFTSSIFSALFGENIDVEKDIDKIGKMLMGTTVEDAPTVEGYDDDKKLFTYTMPNGEAYFSNTPNNTITSDDVQVFFNSSASAMVYKNEEEGVTYNNGDIISEEGSYVVSIVQTPSNVEFSIEDILKENENKELTDEELMEKIDDIKFEDKNNYVCYYRVDIIKKPVCNIDVYNPPENFSLSEVVLDGKQQDISQDYTYRMARDGIYTFVIESELSPNAKHTFNIEKRTQKPKLEVSEKILGGISYEKVSWKKINDADFVQIYSNGNLVEEGKNEGSLKNVGSYQIKVTDSAGNTQSYYFSIASKYNNDAIFVVILLLAVVFGITGYLVYYKKSMNVL